MSSLARAYDRLIDGLAAIAGVMLAVIFVGIVADVAIRTLGYNALQWYSAVAEYCLLFSTMLAAPWLVRSRGHVVVESLTMALPPGPRLVLAKGVYLLCIALSLLFAYYGLVETISAWRAGELDLRSIDMPKWILFLPFPAGFSLIAVEFARYLAGPRSYYSGKAGGAESL